jgi:hypothetical protein
MSDEKKAPKLHVPTLGLTITICAALFGAYYAAEVLPLQVALRTVIGEKADLSGQLEMCRRKTVALQGLLTSTQSQVTQASAPVSSTTPEEALIFGILNQALPGSGELMKKLNDQQKAKQTVPVGVVHQTAEPLPPTHCDTGWKVDPNNPASCMPITEGNN